MGILGSNTGRLPIHGLGIAELILYRVEVGKTNIESDIPGLQRDGLPELRFCLWEPFLHGVEGAEGEVGFDRLRINCQGVAIHFLGHRCFLVHEMNGGKIEVCLDLFGIQAEGVTEFFNRINSAFVGRHRHSLITYGLRGCPGLP